MNTRMLFVKRTYHIYSMLLKVLHFALYTTSHVVSDEALKAESRLYVKHENSSK
jgi:hypothetical protein